MRGMSARCLCIRIVDGRVGQMCRWSVTIHNMCYRTFDLHLLHLHGRPNTTDSHPAKVVFRVAQKVALHNYRRVAHR